jgi:hypothetical protein
MSTLSVLGSFAVVGVVVSAVIEYTKNLFTAATAGKRTVYMLVLSVLGGLVVYFFHLIPANVVSDVVGVIAAVNSAYVFLVQYLPNGPSVPATPSA